MQLHIGDLFISKNTSCIFVIIAVQDNNAIVMIFDYIYLLTEITWQAGLMFLHWQPDFVDMHRSADSSFHLAYRHE